MGLMARVDFWDKRTGSAYLAEVCNDQWRFWEKSWGGARWLDVDATPRLIGIAEARLRGLALSRGA
jgi:hypothetical protein